MFRACLFYTDVRNRTEAAMIRNLKKMLQERRGLKCKIFMQSSCSVNFENDRSHHRVFFLLDPPASFAHKKEKKRKYTEHTEFKK